jgi:hypothetical protein
MENVVAADDSTRGFHFATRAGRSRRVGGVKAAPAAPRRRCRRPPGSGLARPARGRGQQYLVWLASWHPRFRV